MSMKIKKIEYELTAEKHLDVNSKIKCEPKHKIRRLDSIPGASKNPIKSTSNASKGVLSHTEPGFSQTVVRFHQPAVLYFVKLGKFSHQGVQRIRLRSGFDNNGLIIFDYTVKIADAVPQNHQLKHSKDGEQIVSPALTLEYKMVRKSNVKAKLDAVDLEFFGLQNEQLIGEAMQRIQLNRQLLSVKLCLKLFRDQKRYDIVQLLEKETEVQLEHTMLSQLYHNIVVNTNYVLVERIIQRAARENFFNEFLQNRTERKITWRKMESCGSPPARTCPQMCLDSQNKTIYLFGGCDRASKLNNWLLNDLWSFCLSTCTWKMLSASTCKQGGPSARIKATIFFHSPSNKLLICGGTDNSVQLNDLYEYDTKLGIWKKLAHFDRGKSEVDCPLIYGFNENKPCQIYSFASSDDQQPNGGDPALVWYFKRLSSTDSSDSSVKQHKPQARALDTRTGRIRTILSMDGMICTSITFNPINSSFYILAENSVGKKDNKSTKKGLYELDSETHKCSYLGELPFSVCNHMFVATKTGDLICSTYSDPCLPSSSSSTCLAHKHQLWQYLTKTKTWRPIVNQENNLFQKNAAVVFDGEANVFYTFRGLKTAKKLDLLAVPELWKIQVHAISLAELLSKCLWNIRICHFLDLLYLGHSLQAMVFLRRMTVQFGHVDKYKNHISLLCPLLFAGGPRPEEDRVNRVKKLFDYLSNFFPKSMKSPAENLMDIVGHEYSWDFKDSDDWK